MISYSMNALGGIYVYFYVYFYLAEIFAMD